MNQLGRQGQLYCALESTYNTSPGIAATDALRHISFAPTFDPFNRVHNLEKKTSPGRFYRHDRKKSADWSYEGLLRPSGTLNTLPELSEILEAAFGAKSNITLSTTVNAGTGAVGGATLASTTGLVVGQFISIVVSGVKHARQITTLPGANVVTWAPNLPGAPADAAAVRGGITFTLTTPNAKSLALYHYLKMTDQTAGLKRMILGAVVEQLGLMILDANDDPKITARGAAAAMTSSGAPAQPGSFTEVGGNPPSGIVGAVYVGNTPYRSMRLGLEVTTGMGLRMDSAGVDVAEEAFRRGYIDITVALDARGDDQTIVWDPSMAGSRLAVFGQQGFTEGNILAVRLPAVEFAPPAQDDPMEEITWPFRGEAFEAVKDTNDQFALGLL
jgi:hypothetical protein